MEKDNITVTAKVVNFTPYNKGTLQGFSDMEIAVNDVSLLRIYGCPVHRRDGKIWCGLPSRPFQNSEDQTERRPIVRVHNREIWDSIQSQIVADLESFLGTGDSSA